MQGSVSNNNPGIACHSLQVNDPVCKRFKRFKQSLYWHRRCCTYLNVVYHKGFKRLIFFFNYYNGYNFLPFFSFTLYFSDKDR